MSLPTVPPHYPQTPAATEIVSGHWTAISGYANLAPGHRATDPTIMPTPLAHAVAHFVTQWLSQPAGDSLKLLPGIRSMIDLRHFSSETIPCALFLESVLPLLLHCSTDSELRIRGCTHPDSARSVTYFAEVILPMTRRLGRRVEFSIQSFSYGNDPTGEVVLRVAGADGPLESFSETERSPLVELRIFLGTNQIPSDLVYAAAHTITESLEAAGIFWPEIEASVCPSTTPGGTIFVKAEYGNVALGFERTVSDPGAFVGAARMVAHELIVHDTLDVCVDRQLSPFLLSLAAAATICSSMGGYSAAAGPASPPRFSWTTNQMDPSTIYFMNMLTHLKIGVSANALGNAGEALAIYTTGTETL